MYGGDEVNAVVLDVGSCTSKAGYAGEDAPKAVYPSCCGVVARTENGGAAPMEGVTGAQQPQAPNREIYTGSQAIGYRRTSMEIAQALRDGLYSDWELVESLWQHAFTERLRLKSQEHPILLAEPVHNTASVREKTVELMFEKFAPPALFMAKNAVLSSFAIGRQTSLVVDLGYETSVSAAVQDGYVLQKSIVRSPLAGKQLTECMLQSIQSKGATVHPYYKVDKFETSPGQFQAKILDLPDVSDSFQAYHVAQVTSDVKESICRVSDTLFDSEANANIPTVDYELPDGNVIQVGPDRFNVPEVLFQPSALKSFPGVEVQPSKGVTDCSITAAIAKSIELCDVDIRKDMYSGVVASGGTSLLPQLRDRLERDLAESAPHAAKVKVLLPPNAVERRFSVWIGGSILASLGSFQQMWLSKREYEEHGASLIHRRAP